MADIMPNESKYLLEMRGMTKIFPGVRALDGVDLCLREGSVLALMGENGAGKSTLMKCLFGIKRADKGEIFMCGERVEFKDPKDALEHGVAMVHQELNQAAVRSVVENMWLGRYPTRLGFITRDREALERTREIFDRLRIPCDPKRLMRDMSVAERQMAEIAKAVSYDARVLVLDEPTSSLTDREVERLFEMISTLKERGCGIIYISHKMDEIKRIADEVCVMRDGKHIATRRAEDISVDEIIRLMVGREMNGLFPEKTNRPTSAALEVKGLSCRYNHVRDVSFNIRHGEVVGFAGLAGAGRSEVLEAVFGLSSRDGGTIRLDGRELKNRCASEAIRNGFALLTEERRTTGIFPSLDILENVTVPSLKKYSRLGLISDRARRLDAERTISEMRIKTASQSTLIRHLSGGNQQKVIFGRWLLTDPEVLLLDEPTRGIDVGAKYEIYRLINDIASGGRAVAVVSGELPELLSVCDRIYVMSGGRIAGEVDARATSQEEIMRLAAKYV